MYLVIYKSNISRIKSSLIISFWAGLFFSYGHVRLFLNDLFNIGDANLVFITLGIYLISFIVFPIFIIKTKHELNNITKIVMISALVVIMIPIISIGQFLVLDYDYFIGNTENHLDVNSVSIPDYKPDVYYILPDEYAGSKSLEMFWNYNNSNFTNFLIENNFYVAQDSFSNYDKTLASIPTTMNMVYSHVDGNTIDATVQKENNWQVFDNFRSKGYDTYFIESGIYIDFYPNNADHHLCSASDILDLYITRYILLNSMLLPSGVVFMLSDDFRSKILCPFDELDEILNDNDAPKFVLTHVMAPHDPFVFDSDGGHPESVISNLGDITAYREKGYLNQLEFVNSKIKHVVQKLLDTDNPPIIIIQSDHGWRLPNEQDDPSTHYTKILNNFRAYYLPNGDRNMELENNSPVNTFRVLFNTYFDYDYEMLENKFYVINITNDHYVDVTNSLITSDDN